MLGLDAARAPVAVIGMKTRPADEAVEQHRAEDRARRRCRRCRPVLSQAKLAARPRVPTSMQRRRAEPRDQPRREPRHREDAEAQRQEREARRRAGRSRAPAGRTARPGRTSTAGAPTTKRHHEPAPPTRCRLRSRRGWIIGCATRALGARPAGRAGRRRRRGRRGCAPRSSRAPGRRSATRRSRPRRRWRRRRRRRRSGRGGAGSRSTKRRASSSTTMPIGTLMKSVQRHEPTSVTTPPSSRPREAPPEETAAKSASARLRAASSGALVVSRASTPGAASAAPTPWKARAATSWPGSWASPPRSGGDGEERQADLEDAEPAEDVAEAAAEEQQAAEGERVGVEHPRQRRRAEAEVGVDAGERDVHDGGVEHQHQLGDQHDRDAGGGAAGVRRQLGGQVGGVRLPVGQWRV